MHCELATFDTAVTKKSRDQLPKKSFPVYAKHDYDSPMMTSMDRNGIEGRKGDLLLQKGSCFSRPTTC